MSKSWVHLFSAVDHETEHGSVQLVLPAAALVVGAYHPKLQMIAYFAPVEDEGWNSYL